MPKLQTGHKKHEQLITALLASSTIADAAKRAGVSLRTAHRWLADEEFTSAYRQAQRNLLDGAVNSLRASALQFVDTLASVAVDMAAPPGSRAAAASRGLELLLKSVSIMDIEARLAELERSASLLAERRR